MADFVNFYEMLEIKTSATDDAIREAIRVLRAKVRIRTNSPNPDKRHEAEVTMANIAKAEKTLLNAAERAIFDAQLSMEEQRELEHIPEETDLSRRMQAVRKELITENYPSAHRASIEITQLYPDNLEGWRLRREAAAHENSKDELSSLEEIARLLPEDPNSFTDLARAQAVRGNTQKALMNAKKAFEMGNTLKQRALLATCFLDAGEFREAIDTFSEENDKNPGDPLVARQYLTLLRHVYTAQLSNGDDSQKRARVATNFNQVSLGLRILHRANFLSKRLLDFNSESSEDTQTITSGPSQSSFGTRLARVLNSNLLGGPRIAPEARGSASILALGTSTRLKEVRFTFAFLLICMILWLSALQFAGPSFYFPSTVAFFMSVATVLIFRRQLKPIYEHQLVKKTIRRLSRAGYLDIADALNLLLQESKSATRINFHVGKVWGYVLVLVVLSLILQLLVQTSLDRLAAQISAFGVILYIYVKRHFLPNYSKNRKMLPRDRRKTGLQPGQKGVF